jgi:Ca-activated chloride channel family protein
MNELGAIKQYYDTHRDDQWLVQRLSTIVRRYAMATFPRTEVAGLVGASWLQFLDRSGRTNQFTDGVGHLLSSGPYQQQGVVSAIELVQLVEHWIQQVSPPKRRERT